MTSWLLDLTAISLLARRENIPVTKVGNAIRNYKVGVTEDPWLKIPKAKIKDGETFIKERVKGQDHAVVHMMDIIKRAVTGVGVSRAAPAVTPTCPRSLRPQQSR